MSTKSNPRDPMTLPVRVNALRSDKVIGSIVCVFGAVVMAFAMAGLLVIIAQTTILSRVPDAATVGGDRPREVMAAVHSVLLVLVIGMQIGGVTCIISGFFMRRGSRLAWRIARLNAIGGYLWIALYAVGLYRIMPLFSDSGGLLPEPALRMLQLLAILMFTLLGAAGCTGLLYLLWQPSILEAELVEPPRDDAI